MMINNVLFISCLYSENQKDIFLKNSIKGYQFAAQVFQEALLDGFILNGVTPYVVTMPPLGSYPLFYKRPIVRSADFFYKTINCGKSIGYLNLPLIKHYSKNKLLKESEKWCKTIDGKKYILVYGLHSHLLSVAVRLKEKFSNVILGVIAPDLPIFMGCNKYYIKFGFQKKNIELINSLIPKFDCYIVLTEAMAKAMHVDRRPYRVLEGIYSENEKKTSVVKEEKKVILYTGGLILRYGIKDLIDAFMKIPGNEYRLWLCGTGDAEDYIKQCSHKDKRIIFMGMQPQNVIKRLQKQATILVNPRHSNEEFTKFSFPSKTMEYMASATPTLMSRLHCLPIEYNDYLYFFDDESVEGMAKKIKSVCDMDKLELSNKGEKASNFIISEKNSRKQVLKIIDLFENIM